MISFRNADLIDGIEIPLRIGDTVRWSPLGLSRVNDPTYKNLIGRVTKLFDDRLGSGFIGVEWIGNNFEPIKIVARDNIEKVKTTKADLIDKIKNQPLKIGDRVKVKPSILQELTERHKVWYRDNIGIIKEFIYADFARVKWQNDVDTKDNSSNFKIESLERV